MKFKVGDKVTISDQGVFFLIDRGYKPERVSEYYVITEALRNDVDGDFYILDTLFEDKNEMATGFFEDELELIESEV